MIYILIDPAPRLGNLRFTRRSKPKPVNLKLENTVKKIKFLVGFALILASVSSLLLFWDARNVGRVLDGYQGVSVYDNGLLFFRSYGKIMPPMATISAKNGNAWNSLSGFTTRPNITKCPMSWGTPKISSMKTCPMAPSINGAAWSNFKTAQPMRRTRMT